MSGISKTELLELRRRMQADLRMHEAASADLKSALSDLDAAERLLQRIDKCGNQRTYTAFDELASLPFSERNPFRRGSLRAVIWEVLFFAPEVWLTTEAVRQEASKVLKRDVARNSIGVALSRMKPHIQRNGLKVAIPVRSLIAQDLIS